MTDSNLDAEQAIAIYNGRAEIENLIKRGSGLAAGGLMALSCGWGARPSLLTIAMSADGKILFWNTAAEQIFGYGREEAPRLVASCLFDPEDSRLLF
ncbi:MAG: PAS domain-containing protein [Syntrophobacteraceae bacterium]